MALKGEDKIHAELASLLDKHGFTWFHVPNGGKRSKAEAFKLKMMGVKPGVPDILILDNPQTAIELKKKGGRVSAAQKLWGKKFKVKKWNWFVCYSLKEAIDYIERIYGCRLRKNKLPEGLRPEPRS